VKASTSAARRAVPSTIAGKNSLVVSPTMAIPS
jgi:hypothetical protein